VGRVKVLVTGAFGFVGQWVVRRALERGFEVRALSRSERRLVQGEAVRADLRDERSVSRAVVGCDAVVHLAVPAYLSDDGTAVLLESMKKSGVGRLVLVSSLSVYDYVRLAVGATLDERSPLESRPERRDEYCRVKLAQEATARAAGLDLSVLRPGAIIGPGRLWTARLGRRLGPLTVVLGGQSKVPVCYVAHVADAIVSALGRPGAVGATLNLVDDALPTQNQYLSVLRQVRMIGAARVGIPRAGLLAAASVGRAMLGERVRLPNVLSAESLEAQIKPLDYSNEQARKLLSWRPTYGWEEAVRRSARPASDPGVAA